ncbi:MAG: hypothetical protein IPP40_08070 [bacterium]|nr:hypothetical protein [bacterium]
MQTLVSAWFRGATRMLRFHLTFAREMVYFELNSANKSRCTSCFAVFSTTPGQRCSGIVLLIIIIGLVAGLDGWMGRHRDFAGIFTQVSPGFWLACLIPWLGFGKSCQSFGGLVNGAATFHCMAGRGQCPSAAVTDPHAVLIIGIIIGFIIGETKSWLRKGRLCDLPHFFS